MRLIHRADNESFHVDAAAATPLSGGHLRVPTSPSPSLAGRVCTASGAINAPASSGSSGATCSQLVRVVSLPLGASGAPELCHQSGRLLLKCSPPPVAAAAAAAEAP